MAPETAHARQAFGTQRRDLWWVEPLWIVVLFTAFVVYATFRIFEANNPATRFFEADDGHFHYLSPFGTPDLTGLVPHALTTLPYLGVFFTNPGFLILPVPAAFRFTCYYYRKAYYRSFVGRPAACGVEAVKGRKYRGEKGLMIFQNVHRYALYLAILVMVFLAIDFVRGIYTPHGWYFGFGNVLMGVNVALLAGYTFGCHSLRHLVGGKLDCFTCDAVSQTRYSVWKRVSMLNSRHMFWAITSLISVGLTDVYIRWVAMHPGVTHLFGVVPV